MFGRKPDEDAERWYLLPAMQHGAKRKFYTRLFVAILVGTITAAALAALIYFNNRI